MKGAKRGGEETRLVKQILDYLAYKRIWAYRVNTGGLLNQTGRLVRFGVPGHPDIVARMRPVHPNEGSGRVLWIEAKAAKGRLSEHQVAWKGRAEEYGDTFIVARCLEDVSCLFDKPKDARISRENAPGSTQGVENVPLRKNKPTRKG
jgi:hypothetical protein